MKFLYKFICSCAITAAAVFNLHASPSGFEVGDSAFMLDGKPFVIKAAELHYPRIPRPYWDHRIKMSKALGMNTICLYVFWNFHEQNPGEFDFSGQRDIREFIELCAANDMKVILRPGPYVCAEWEMGGLPWWLLKDKDIRLREEDPRFMDRVERFMKQVADRTKGLMDADGGPVIMVQVENEYGSYGTNKPYVAAIRDMVRNHFGEDVVLFQCDWSSNFTENGLDDLLWTMNFGTGADIDSQFAELKRIRPNSPLMCSEFWSGWFDKWGARHETRPADEMIAGIKEMLDKDISFSLYMTHGGTNPGHWAGANSPGYAPDVTSYDYDAPISEDGTTTPKYDRLRQLLADYSDTPLSDVPAALPVISIPQFSLKKGAPLWDNLPKSITDNSIRPMEMYNQGFGSIVYSFKVPEDGEDIELIVDEPRDYAQIFIDGKKKGTLDRRKGDTRLSLGSLKKGDNVDILVEAMGRINFGRAIKDYKGISRDAVLVCRGDSFSPMNVNVTLLPDDLSFYKSRKFKKISKLKSEGGRFPAGVYSGSFKLDSVGDTYLDMSSWGKGLVYVNGYDLGRFWEIGPQQTLYLPGCYLRKGKNEILIFDILGPREVSVKGLTAPILDSLQENMEVSENVPVTLPSDLEPWLEADFKAENFWQTVLSDVKGKGQYLIVECISANDGGADVAIAELELLDVSGNPVAREGWRVLSVSSEDVSGGNHTGEKAFDSQESTFWRNVPGSKLPQLLIINLGGDYEVSGLKYLPRMESGAPQALGKCRIYLLDKIN